MEIRQQIIQDHIEKIAQLLNINEDQAFLRFGHCHY
jgi:DNA polymerase III gamma/tau subunit